jgi:hypothetical protein
MSLVPTTCPECDAPEVLYSTGVIHNILFTDITSPVVRCGSPMRKGGAGLTPMVTLLRAYFSDRPC